MKRIIIVLISLAAGLAMARSQSPAEDFEAVGARHASLTERERAIAAELAEVRALPPEELERYADHIIDLEGRLYLVRDSLETVAGQLHVMRAAMPEGNSTQPVGEPERSINIVNSHFLRDNLSPEDYSLLLSRQEREHEVAQYVAQVMDNYDQLAILVPVYGVAEKGPRADTLYHIIDSLARGNEALLGEMEPLWRDVFDTKVYLYNYVLDKTGQVDALREMERQMANLTLLQSDIEGEYMYDAVAGYVLQRMLTLNYERRIANSRSLRKTADSLAAESIPSEQIPEFFLPKLDVGERLFLDLADVAVSKPAKYNGANPIPSTQIHPRGTVYRILLGAFPRAQPVSLFRGAWPLSREIKTDRKHYYYAGGYATAEEAQAAAQRLKTEVGFTNPRVVVWTDGVYADNPGGSGDGGGTAPRKPARGGSQQHYRVEIAGAGDSLSEVVRGIILTRAAGKELSRTVTPEGNAMFVVGTFNSQSLASSLADEILACEPTFQVTVVKVE